MFDSRYVVNLSKQFMKYIIVICNWIAVALIDNPISILKIEPSLNKILAVFDKVPMFVGVKIGW